MSEQKPETRSELSNRAVLLVTVAIIVFVGGGVWAGVFVIPVYETHAVLQRFSDRWGKDYSDSAHDPEEGIKRLGGPERAISRLRTYLRLPRWAAPRRVEAVEFLGYCARSGLVTHAIVQSGPSGGTRAETIIIPRGVRPTAGKAVRVLIEALGHEDPGVRSTAAYTLEWIGPEAREALPTLRKLLKDEDANVRHAADWVLKRFFQEKWDRSSQREPFEPK